MDAPRIQYARTLDGVRIAYTTYGSGPPLLWLNDIPTMQYIQHVWEQPWFGALAERVAANHMLVLYDCRGCGLSARWEGMFSLDILQLDAEAVLGQLAIERFGLVSMGSFVPTLAISFVAKHRTMVSRLAIIDGLARPRDMLNSSGGQVLTDALRRDWHLFTENVALQVNGWTADEARRFGEHLRANVDYRTARHYLAFFGGVDVSDELPHIDIPVLVVHHKALRYMTLDSSADLASMIPGAQLLPLEGLFSESTGALADALIAFFSDNHGQSDTGSSRTHSDGPTLDRVRPAPLVAQPNGTSRAPRPGALSKREVEVLQLIAGGLSNQQIAVRLAISLNTVFRHVTHIYEKTGATNRVEAAAYARTRDPS